MLTPEEIASRQFLVTLRGYDRDEVSAFLREVASEHARALDDLRVLARQLEQSRRDLEAPQGRPPTQAPSAVEAAGVESAPSSLSQREVFAALGEETTRILVAAEESAQAIREKAEERARTDLENARREARDEVEGARRTASKIVADAERRRNAIAEDIRTLEGTRDAFVQGLRSAMKGVQGSVRGMQTASGTTQLAAGDDDDPGPAPTAPPAVGTTQEPDLRAEPEPQPEPETPERHEPEDAELSFLDRGDEEPAEVDDEPVDEPVEEPEPAPVEEPEPAPEPVDEPEPEPDPEPEDEPEPGPPIEEEEVAAPAPTSAADPLTLREQALTGVRPGMLRRLKRALQDVQNGVLDGLRQAGAEPDIDAVLPSDDDLAPVGAVGQMFLTASYRAGIADGAILVDQDVPDGTDDASRVPGAAATFRNVVSHEVTSALRATIRAGVEAGEAETSLSERVGEVFRDLKGPVVEQVVDEHLARMYGLGQLDVWRRVGVPRSRWVLGQEPRCPANRCRLNDEDGGVELGAEYPSGDRVPPAHDGCTCGLAPEGAPTPTG